MKLIIYTVLLGALFASCGKRKAKDTHEKIYDQLKSVSGYTFYKNDAATTIATNASSGHNDPKYKTRYNTIATSQLNINGKVNAGAIFPQGSLIVKDLYDNDGKLSTIAFMYKDSTSEYKDGKGWVWGTFKDNGKAKYSVHKIGKDCISCHSQAENIDYSLMNKFVQ